MEIGKTIRSLSDWKLFAHGQLNDDRIDWRPFTLKLSASLISLRKSNFQLRLFLIQMISAHHHDIYIKTQTNKQRQIVLCTIDTVTNYATPSGATCLQWAATVISSSTLKIPNVWGSIFSIEVWHCTAYFDNPECVKSFGAKFIVNIRLKFTNAGVLKIWQWI